MVYNLEELLKIAHKMCQNMDYVSVLNGFDKIYPFTTENISAYIPYFNLNDKSLLTVGSSGDQVINASMMGCRNITLIDVNPFTKYYFYLKQAAMLSLSMQEFFDFFCFSYYKGPSIDNDRVFNFESYKKLSSTLKSLDYDSYSFWDELFNIYPGLLIRDMFKLDEYQVNILRVVNRYLENENCYDYAAKCLVDSNVTFVNNDLRRLRNISTYDNVWLSNIGKYISLYDLKRIACKCYRSMNYGGSILLSYIYNVDRFDTFNYTDEWAPIYDAFDVMSRFRFYNIEYREINSIVGADGVNNKYKDAVYLLKKK